MNYIHHFTLRQGMLGMFSTEQSTQLLKKAQEEGFSQEEYEQLARSITGASSTLPHWTRFGVFVEKPSF